MDLIAFWMAIFFFAGITAGAFAGGVKVSNVVMRSEKKEKKRGMDSTSNQSDNDDQFFSTGK